MSGSEYGGTPPVNGSSSERGFASPGRMVAARSASPAKRSAADMEAGEQQQQQQLERTDDDVAMEGMTPARDAIETTTTNGTTSSSASTPTSTTSLRSEGDRPAPEDPKHPSPAHLEPYSTAETDEQVSRVQMLANQELDEGTRGVVISHRWLARVLSRTSEGERSGEYPKEAREGYVGPLDNSDIVPDHAFESPFLKDQADSDFIPLKPGLTISHEFDVLPYDAYAFIIGAYGITSPKPIIRYAHNTAEPGAMQTNIQYELYPPIITIRKVPQPSQVPEKQTASKSSLDNLRLKQEREGRGQRDDQDSPRLVSSRSEKFQKFLSRAKEAAGIPQTTKVRVLRALDPTTVVVDQPNSQQPGVLSPPASRDASPAKHTNTSLVIDTDTFSRMEIGKDLEATDTSDETNNSKYNGKSTMDTLGFFQSQTIILEEQLGGPAGGEFRSDAKKGSRSFLSKSNLGPKTGSATTSGRTSPAPGGMMTRGRTLKNGRTRGTVGLTNLGNTCYMNSALQCIRSNEELAVYFLSGKFKPEINNDNPLGHHGAMANAYAGVLKGIYNNNSGGSYTPTDFKRMVGRLQPMFSGYGQQDSQEFLSFLVDALHEDLNRIQKKPYIENPDSDDSRVQDPEYILELGEIYRSNHRKRNDSIAMDLFSGFYKNTMQCPVCSKVSVTFDPYSLVTVQLPMDHAFQHHFTFIPLHGKPVMHHIDMDKNSTIKILKEYIASKHAGVEASRLWLAEVYSSKIYKVFDDQTTIAEHNISQNDHMFIWEMDSVPTNVASSKKSFTAFGMGRNSDEDRMPDEGMDSPKADVIAVPIFSRVANKTGHGYGAVLYPVYITVSREEAKDYELIMKKVLIAVATMTTRPILTEFDKDKSSSHRSIQKDNSSIDERGSAEDAAGISDHSAPSEDGYVNVSLAQSADSEDHENGTSPKQVDGGTGTVPPDFMDPQYLLPPALRNHLFDLKWAESNESNIHCAGLNSIRDGVHPMFGRVKQQSRRPSIDSSASGESTTTSNDSGNQANGESDDGEVDPDTPDIVLGNEVPLSAELVDGSDDELAGPTLPRGGRANTRKKWRGKNKKNAKRNGALYGKNGHGRSGQGRGTGFITRSSQQDDSPYYIQIGESIVLDWHPEAYESLFGGDKYDPSDFRGLRYIDSDGRGAAVFDDAELKARQDRRNARKKNGVTLDDCFAETSKKEVLSEDNAWYCNRCKELRQADKQLEIWTLPDILVVHMKRFGVNRSFRDKIDVLVDYPLEGLDMTGKVGLKEEGKEYIYDLFAVDNHYGGLGGGHYTATAKNFHDGEWYDYNDSSCSKVGSSMSKSSAAYLLFYRRRSEGPLGPPALQALVNEYRNPPESTGDEAEDGSGEGRLGGLTHSSQHGSSSASVVAGVGATSSQKGIAENGGIGAGSPLIQKQTMTTNNDDEGESGVPLNRQFGNQGASWGFNTIDDDADALLSNVDDNDSTKAEGDNDSAFGGSNASHMHMDIEDNLTFSFPAQDSPYGAGLNSQYETAPAYDSIEGDTLVENTDLDDPPATDIHLGDVPDHVVQSRLD